MSYAVPVFIAVVIIHALSKKTSVYGGFTDGAKTGAEMLFEIFPAVLAMTAATAVLKASGALEALCGLLAPVMRRTGINEDIILLGVMRPLSGGASLGLVSDIIARHGADSFIGRLASVMMGSTETTFYTLAVYFSKTKVKYTKRVIPAAVFGDIVGLFTSWAVCKIFF